MGGGICMTWGIVRLGFGGRRIGGNLQGKESTRSATQRGSVLRKEAPVARLGLSMSQAAACEVLVFHVHGLRFTGVTGTDGLWPPCTAYTASVLHFFMGVFSRV